MSQFSVFLTREQLKTVECPPQTYRQEVIRAIVDLQAAREYCNNGKRLYEKQAQELSHFYQLKASVSFK